MASTALVAGAMAFPQLTVQFEKAPFFTRALEWVVNRADVALKKALAVGLLTWLLHFFALPPASSFMLIPRYFATLGAHPAQASTIALLAIAFVTVAMRALIVPMLSKVLAVALLPAAFMMAGYTIAIGESLNRPSAVLSLGLVVWAALDLASFVLQSSDP